MRTYELINIVERLTFMAPWRLLLIAQIQTQDDFFFLNHTHLSQIQVYTKITFEVIKKSMPN